MYYYAVCNEPNWEFAYRLLNKKELKKTIKYPNHHVTNEIGYAETRKIMADYKRNGYKYTWLNGWVKNK